MPCETIARRPAAASDGVDSGSSGADLVCLIDREDEHLAVPGLAGVCGIDDRLGDVLRGDFGDGALDFDLPVEVDAVLLAAPLALLDRLGAAAGDVRNCQRGGIDLGQRDLDLGQRVGSDVPQPRVYDALDTLSSKGFVDVQPGRPKKFGPVAPGDAVERFREFKQRQYDEELSEIGRLGEQFVDSVDDTPEPTERSEICWTYSNRHHILEKLAELAGSASSEIRMITTPLSFEHIPNHHVEELSRQADAGATIQAVVSEDGTVPPAVYDRAEEIMEIRRVENVEGRIYLYDSSHVLVAFAADNDDGYVGISTTSDTLYKTKSQLFELLWADGREPDRESADDAAVHLESDAV